jgi:hypothetical protein
MSQSNLTPRALAFCQLAVLRSAHNVGDALELSLRMKDFWPSISAVGDSEFDHRFRLLESGLQNMNLFEATNGEGSCLQINTFRVRKAIADGSLDPNRALRAKQSSYTIETVPPLPARLYGPSSRTLEGGIAKSAA